MHKDTSYVIFEVLFGDKSNGKVIAMSGEKSRKDRVIVKSHSPFLCKNNSYNFPPQIFKREEGSTESEFGSVFHDLHNLLYLFFQTIDYSPRNHIIKFQYCKNEDNKEGTQDNRNECHNKLYSSDKLRAL